MTKNADLVLRGSWQNFLSFPGEKLLLVIRKHWITLVMPLLMLFAISTILFFSSLYIFLIFLKSPPLFIVALATLLLLPAVLTAKIVTTWYFYFYIITNKKILEVYYYPLSSFDINDVLLSQVRCTEIDIRRDGFVNQLLDIGAITITFDRPTHQEEFVLWNIQHSREIGTLLSAEMVKYDNTSKENVVWYKNQKNNGYRFIEGVHPGAAY